MKPILLILSLLHIFAGMATARVWTVAADSTGEFLLIQDAIEAADNGDEIRIGPGTYVETLHTRSKVIDLIGEDGDDLTIVDAGAAGAAITIPYTPGGVLHIRGLTFTNGIGKILRPEALQGRFGGGACIELAYPEFEDCSFFQNVANMGGGIYVIAGAADFTRCAFEGNGAGIGGGIALEHDGGVRLTDCIINDNVSVFGGGLYLFHSQLRIDNCEVRGNSATEGGAVQLLEGSEGTVWITDSILADNSSDRGGAIHMHDAALVVQSTTIAGNFSSHDAACIEMTESQLLLGHTVVSIREGGGLFICDGVLPGLACVVLWSHQGDQGDCVEGEQVLFADPLFCNPESGDYTLGQESPCLPGQGPSDCGLIGALGEGCSDPVPVETTHWGAIKATFR